MHPALATIIAETPIAGQLTFLTSVTGAAFSSASFGNVFRDWCNEADLPKRCSSQGCARRRAGGSPRPDARNTRSPRSAVTKASPKCGDTPARPAAAKMAKSAMATVTAAFPERALKKDEIGNRDLQTLQKKLANLPVTHCQKSLRLAGGVPYRRRWSDTGTRSFPRLFASHFERIVPGRCTSFKAAGTAENASLRVVAGAVSPQPARTRKQPLAQGALNGPEGEQRVFQHRAGP